MEKPILFSTPMVQAIWNGRKTQTRRIIKPHPSFIECDLSKVYKIKDMKQIEIKPPYNIGDILWVRETWKKFKKRVGRGNDCRIEEFYGYKADENNCDNPSEFYDGKWKPSIHMPREAARIFPTVKNIRAERLQGISELDAFSEGIDEESEDFLDAEHYQSGGVPIRGGSPAVFTFIGLWDNIYASPAPVKEHGIITHYESYPWEGIQETRTYKGLPWIVYGNPYVWVIEFEKA